MNDQLPSFFQGGEFLRSKNGGGEIVARWPNDNQTTVERRGNFRHTIVGYADLRFNDSTTPVSASRKHPLLEKRRGVMCYTATLTASIARL